MAALNEMQPDGHLWMAFQPNTLKDFNAQLPKEWPQMINEIRSRLEHYFNIPILSYNLRNASEVYNMTEALEQEDILDTEACNIEVKDTLGVTTIAMTIHAITPKLIPIAGREPIYQVVGDAILFAIHKTREETGEPNSSFVILHCEDFQTDEIIKSIQSKKGRDDQVFKYPPNLEDENPSLEYLDDLLENNVQGFLVMNDKSFKGAESKNLILLMADGAPSANDIRCNMLRCISNLSILHVISENNNLKFDKIRQFDTFLECRNKCESQFFQCQTCTDKQKVQFGEQNKKSVFICVSCKMRKSCHPINHKFKKLANRDLFTDQVKCGCKCNDGFLFK